MITLGIETSCDETGIGVVKDGRLITNLVASQEKIHSIYGGVMPEMASRAHLQYIDNLFIEALRISNILPEDIDAIGVTHHPGLKGSLLVGVSFACGLALSINRPLYMVNHLYAHISSNFLDSKVRFPAIGIVVSGGHTTFFYIENPVKFSVIGKTLDDACGETFDKVGRMLGLPFPGGPNVEKEALKGDENKIKFPVPLLSKKSLDFSFSGLKTSVLYHIKKFGTKDNVPDICAGFQKAVGDILVEKVKRAIDTYKPESFLVGGGVIQNRYIRKRLNDLATNKKIQIFIPDTKLCMDNGAMVAVMTWRLLKEGVTPSDKSINVIPT
ncbi:tRNA (adenosine(37)-N6)-threonylcarbamoyltransferase complex transferase subunit TsaD [bacterium]|nr:tRNA (adenosine(37)-N6)-threonylcarbamoyltransferase complex transferase subunit TsaD [bacterium]